MRLNGGTVVIGGDFNFGQANCYDTIWMTNSADWLEVYGNWNYITLTDMEGKWTAGNICFFGPIWEVNEASGPKSIYSSGSQVIHFGYEGGKQTVLWDNCETYINNEDGSLNTERTFNFDGGIDFIYDFTAENYWFRPWWRPYDEPDYTLYRKGWEMGDGVHPATGNYTKTFVDLAVKSPGMDADFVRTYNSTNTEEGSFGIGWDFNLDVSKIIQPAENYYQVVLPNCSNTTFKQNGTKFECENAHSTMEKNSSGYVVTLNDQTKYYFNNKLEMYRMEDPHGDTIEISAIDGNHVRTVTDSTGRQYKITYTSNDAHKRITKIEDPTSGRIVEYTYDINNQQASANSILGAVESYSYDDKKHLNKITNCYDEVTEEVTETETPVAEEEDIKEDNTAITTDAEITIVEDEIIVDDIEDADGELNTDSATTPNITPAQAMIDKKICDFNGDDKYNAKDRLYITTHRTIKAPNLNNRTDSSRILISAYTE